MLIRTSPANYDGPTGGKVQIVHKSFRAATNQAVSHYAGDKLDEKNFITPDGLLPGCEFSINAGLDLFTTACVFGTTDPANARYDYFELENGNLTLLESVPNSDDPVLTLRIRGVAPAVTEETDAEDAETPAEPPAIRRAKPRRARSRRTGRG